MNEKDAWNRDEVDNNDVYFAYNIILNIMNIKDHESNFIKDC